MFDFSAVYMMAKINHFRNEARYGTNDHFHITPSRFGILTVKFLYWYQEFLCSVEPLHFSDEKSITVEK